MIISMTGFGRAEASSNGIAVTAEIKSVNSRYLDISFRLPPVLKEKELALKEQLQSRINRGKVNISARIDKTEKGEPEIAINPKLARGYKQLLEELRKAANINDPVSLENLIPFEEIFVSREQNEETIAKIWQLTQSATEKAVDRLMAMRKKEGGQLENDLKERVDHIGMMMKKIRELTENRAEHTRKKLLDRIRNLVDDDALDPERLELEVAVLVDKMDITEELVRVESHLKFFREALEQDDSVGRRLNFLSQEINREINTIGSKANSSEISTYVVQAKESLEQIREQVQNIE